MIDPKHIHISDYNYSLPDERIAKVPIAERDHSKLLVYRHGEVEEDVFYHLPDYLPKGALMVFNNTKVIQARLHFRKETGALIEVFLLEPAEPADYEQMFQTTGHCSWYCLVGNLKKGKEGTLTRTLDIDHGTLTINATRGEIHGTSYRIDFSWEVMDNDQCAMSFADVIDAMGELPIPPYLNRETQERDKTTYQTVYSKIKGSVAAPTAGLHFTQRVLDAIDQRGIEREEVTLHVGLGTFRPVKVEDVSQHHMHREFYQINEETATLLNRAKSEKRRIICVGTTSCRTLETACDQNGQIRSGSGWTDIFIYPGYQFKAVDALITNFHLPESTLMMLVSALAGREHIMKAYEEAVKEKYRFFSFGDAMLIK